MPADHYKTLGVVATANAADLRAAYLKLARSNHPDKFAGDERTAAEAKMQAINEAWNVLGVAHKRREYDRSRPSGDSTSASKPGASNSMRGNAHFKPFDYEPLDYADIDLDATPLAGSKALPQWAAFVPIGLLISGIFVMAFGSFVKASSLFAIGLICLILGGVSFLMFPLVAMSRAERDPNL